MQFIKNNSTRIVIIILSLVLITCCSVGATFAKYTASDIAQSTARVAKWDVRAGEDGKEVYASGAFANFSLFDYLEDSDSTVSGPTTEVDVKDDGKTIAPGTKGRFRFDVQNYSEVAAEYTVAFEEVNTADVPIQFSVDGTVWHDNAADLNQYFVKIPLEIQEDEVINIVYWKWDFERGQDAFDTNLGITQPDVIINITLTVDQVD